MGTKPRPESKSPRPRSLALPKREHLRSPRDFRRVYERHCSLSDGRLVIFASPNDLGFLRLGLSVSRKIGNAVKRNRFRRLYREAFRLTRGELPAGLDLILIPRGVQEPALIDLQQSLVDLVTRLKKKLTP